MAGNVHIVAGVIEVDDFAFTPACLLIEDCPKVCRVFVHGRPLGRDALAYMKEVALPHALRVLREWIHDVDQRQIQHITI